MIGARNELLLATLKRAAEPLDSDELLAQATELALDHLWTPEHLAGLTRKGVAKRCGDMLRSGLVVEAGKGFDGKASRATPKYAPAEGYNAAAEVPQPPALREPASVPRETPTLNQVIAVIDAQAELLEEHTRSLTRIMGEVVQSNQTVSNLREKLRARLMAAGLVDA